MLTKVEAKPSSQWLKRKISRISGAVLLSAGLLIPAAVNAAMVDAVFVGTWDSVGAANTTGISAGQKFVINLSYDDLSTVNNEFVRDAFGSNTTNPMDTIDLQAAGNSLDIYVPMLAFDSTSPFIYQQDESTHDTIFTPVPTLNFADGSDISDINNIIGLEFEGGMLSESGNNILSLFNSATQPGGGPNMMTAQLTNLGVGTAATDNNPLQSAVDLMVEAGSGLVFNASTLVQTATATVTQSNDLGAGRSDGEDFVDFTWSAGNQTGDSTDLGIAASGLTSTTDTAVLSVAATEQMTGKTANDSLAVSYANATPSLNASAVANGDDVDFTFDADDLDLAVNALVSGFEALSFSALLDGLTDVSSYFTNLFQLGNLSASNASLLAQFGLGTHEVMFEARDIAGTFSRQLVQFEVLRTTTTPNPNPVSEPGAILLMLTGLVVLMRRRAKTYKLK